MTRQLGLFDRRQAGKVSLDPEDSS